MNIFVTGAAGFIGHTFCRKLSESGHVVYGLVHDRLRRGADYGNTCLIRGDVTDLRRMQAIIVDQEIDYVYHFAAKSIVQNCRRDPLGCFHANVMGTAAVLEAVRLSERECPVMCMESDKAYGHGPTPYKEDQALLPHGVYEASKTCVAHLVTTYHRNYGLPVFGVRSANVYGPGDANLTRLIPGTIVNLLNGEQPVIHGGVAEFTRQYLFIDDLFRIVTTLMDYSNPWGRSVNVSSVQDPLSVIDTVKTICDMMGVEYGCRIEAKPKTFTEIRNQSLDLSLLSELYPPGIGLETRSLEAGLLATIPWYREMYSS